MNVYVEILIGIVLALVVIAPFFRKDRPFLLRFFSVTLVLAAVIYFVFAASGLMTGTADSGWLLTELFGVPFFALFAYFGMKGRPWLVSLGWVLHLFWDAALHGGPGTSFVPEFYPGLCIGFDLAFAAFAAYFFYLGKKT